MAKQQENGRPLPKFGEWDVSNPASAEGFTVIFNKARDEKTRKITVTVLSPRKSESVNKSESSQYPRKSKWFCCG